MIKETLTNNLKQSSKINMILDTGRIIKKVKVGWRNNNMVNKILETSIYIEKVFPMTSNPDYPNYKINMVLESPPIKNGKMLLIRY